MDLQKLQSARHTERQKDSLQSLRDTFYQDAGEYLQELYDEREAAADAADDPFSASEVQELTDKIETAEHTVESLYERRMGKIVKEASLEAADIGEDIESATTEERELFESLVGELEANRERVLSVLDSGGNPDAVSTNDTGDADTPDEQNSDSDPVDEGKTGSNESNDGSTSAEFDVPRTRVRMTSDVGEIFGVDQREYDLQEEDVVMLPTQNADPLIKNDAAIVAE